VKKKAWNQRFGRSDIIFQGKTAKPARSLRQNGNAVAAILPVASDVVIA
jgi:hypothetical protein